MSCVEQLNEDHSMKHYELNGHTYTVEKMATNRYQMTVWDEADHTSYGITDPSLIINVMLNGKPMETK